jgi:hypothetical protein
MATPSAGDLRNFGLVDHASSGKPTLARLLSSEFETARGAHALGGKWLVQPFIISGLYLGIAVFVIEQGRA